MGRLFNIHDAPLLVPSESMYTCIRPPLCVCVSACVCMCMSAWHAQADRKKAFVKGQLSNACA